MAYVSSPEEMGIEKGIEKGIVIGKEKGIAIGKEKGVVIGIQETKRDTVFRMLRKGFGVADIAECVDLPEEEVRRLAEENAH